MIMNDLEIYELTLTNFPKAIHLLARSFVNYPEFQATLPDDSTREKKLLILFQTIVNYTYRYGKAYLIGESVPKGIMCCLPHTQFPLSNWKFIYSGASHILFSLGLNFIRKNEKIAHIEQTMHLKYMKQPHLYLWFIGVDPVFQGQKIGHLLIEYLQILGTQNQLPCYLDTSSLKNVQIYQRLGFKLLETYPLLSEKLNLYAMVWNIKK